ncbi:LuxR C-terminal-related transcriptional regulator [Ktedonobacter racemifer]
MAVRFAVTERTVNAHLASIYAKLGVDSRAAAVAVALEQGLLSFEE